MIFISSLILYILQSSLLYILYILQSWLQEKALVWKEMY